MQFKNNNDKKTNKNSAIFLQYDYILIAFKESLSTYRFTQMYFWINAALKVSV